MRIIAFTLGLVLGSGVAATAQPTDYPVMAQSADLPAVQIAGLWWMQENLSVTRYQNGDSIPDGTADHPSWAQLSTGAWAYPDSQAALRSSFGLLYNWYAVNDPRGLCPTGWRLPTHDEWTALTHALGGETKAGAVLKASQGWLPAGFRGSDGTYGGLGAYAYWWSSTGSGINGAWGRFVDGTQSGIFMMDGYKRSAFSVRCVAKR
jgi:uncharacterized protein (TIGR02145 family)